MSPIRTIARRELKALVDQPTAYILLVVFTAVNGFLTFRQLELYNVASLRPMLDFLPWLLLFLVPAVTMRALAEDARAGTLEVVLAQPISELELLLGKYVGLVLFLWLALALARALPLSLTPQGEALKRLRSGTALLAAVTVVVNLFGRQIGGRIDLTPGRAFTLSRTTRQLMATLPDLVTIKLFTTAALPPEVAFLKRDVDD